MPAPLLILPIEERNRELNSRVLIALHAIDAGFDVIIGQQWELFSRFPGMSPSIVLFKGNNGMQARHMAEAKSAGHIVCSIEEEVLAVYDSREILRCYDKTAGASLDLIFAQGDHQRTLLEDLWPELKDKIAVVGNPRADLLRYAAGDIPSDTTEYLRERHGPFVLFNSNLACINPKVDDIYGFFELCVHVGVADPGNAEQIQRLYEGFLWERANFKALTTLALKLAEDGVNVILRPHPSEYEGIWHDQMAGIPGITVTHEGSQLDWLKASSLMVHSGCTTGLEAFLMGHPVVALVPGEFSWHDTMISNLVNPTFKEISDARRAAHDHLDGTNDLNMDRAAAHTNLRPYLRCSPDHSAAERIVDELTVRHPCEDQVDANAIINLFGDTKTHLSRRRTEKAAFNREEIDAAIKACSALSPPRIPVHVQEIAPVVYYLSGHSHDL
jgi:surface carbohydrate biosynthesis protein